MPHNNASIVLDMDMLARVFNLNLFIAYEEGVVLLCWGGWRTPLGNSSDLNHFADMLSLRS